MKNTFDPNQCKEERSVHEHLGTYRQKIREIRDEFSKIVVGQRQILDKMLIALFCRGHILLEGAPGMAKTLMVRTLARMSGGTFSRVQFTPDLLPTDITGVVTYDEQHRFHVIKGPIFANFVLADEINRTPPKVQSALLEAMQERQVTIGKQVYALEEPFLLLATMNPIETLGTYTLPEAQLDRFLFKVEMSYPTRQEEEQILSQNINTRNFDDFQLSQILDKETIMEMQRDVHLIFAGKQIQRYIINLIDATRNPSKYGIESGKYIEYGASPRASISLFITAKAHALISNRHFVTPHDIKMVAPDVLRHRLILNYEAQAEDVKVGDVIKELLEKVVVP